ncbi:MAG: SDR family oxidoreductase [Bacteroides sp.]|nr:SDR family oxidoreductase [Eubacterium sp.]MCM1418061.1 SDR family oxidoreductase [Roseburia sp.]MCM1462205.1 SDR family oxidoreductase [Bacteroides sp.]
MRTAIITGGTGAIGKALVAEFSRDHSVIFTYRENETEARRLAEKHGAEGIRLDLSDPAQVARLEPFLPNSTLLINNAGIAQIKLFSELTDEDWEKMIGVDLSGVFYLSRAAVRHMIRRKEGCIINISSVWGVYGASCEVHYSAAKAGVIGMTKALAKELGPSGIRVNCIAPGVIDSPMNGHLDESERDALIDETPLGRLGTPEEVAHAARFFAENAFTTGQILGVDGGFC